MILSLLYKILYMEDDSIKDVDTSLDGIFFITKDTSTVSNEINESFDTFGGFGFNKDREEEKKKQSKLDYIISEYNLQTEEERRMNQARMDMMRNITSKQAELQSRIHSKKIFPFLTNSAIPKTTERTQNATFRAKKGTSVTGKLLLYSSFCGQVVHKSCLERERKNPTNPKEFVKICDKCNHAYLERKVLLPYWKNCQKVKIIVDDRERKYEKLAEKLAKIEADHVNIKNLVFV